MQRQIQALEDTVHFPEVWHLKQQGIVAQTHGRTETTSMYHLERLKWEMRHTLGEMLSEMNSVMLAGQEEQKFYT